MIKLGVLLVLLLFLISCGPANDVDSVFIKKTGFAGSTYGGGSGGCDPPCAECTEWCNDEGNCVDSQMEWCISGAGMEEETKVCYLPDDEVCCWVSLTCGAYTCMKGDICNYPHCSCTVTNPYPSSASVSGTTASFTTSNRPSKVTISSPTGNYVVAKTSSGQLDIDMSFVNDPTIVFYYLVEDSTGASSGSFEIS